MNGDGDDRSSRSGSRGQGDDNGGRGSGGRRCLHVNFPVTRQFGLLVRDQDVLDLIWKSTPSEMDLIADRFLAIQDAIEALDVATIDRVARQNPDFLFRRIVGAIKRGVIDGDWWCAGYTTRIIIGEAFSKTPDYFEALRSYCESFRE